MTPMTSVNVLIRLNQGLKPLVSFLMFPSENKSVKKIKCV